MTDLGRRIISALVLGPPVLLLVWWGNPGFAVLAAAVAAVITWEWNGITRGRRADAAMILAAVAAGAAVLAAALGQWLVAGIVVMAGAILAQAMADRTDGDRLLWLGVLYAALPAAALVMLRDDPQWGRLVVFWLLLVVWATDVGAFAAGRLIGGPKLWPAVSPKKTWAGAVGGLIAAMAVGAAFIAFAAPTVALWTLFGVILCLSVAAQFGDIAESALKRRFGVKDSSDLIPGHGGVMDRVDGLVFAALAAGAVGALRGGAEAAGGGLLLW